MNAIKLVPVFLLVVNLPAVAANDKDYTYLALGDSVPFGMNETLLPPFVQQLPSPSEFVGYPESVAAAEHWADSKKEVNASCPGETSGSFLNEQLPDNGCNSPHYQPPFDPIPPFKTAIGLHTPYTIAQMDFAEAELQSNKHINLVTLTIGANDVLLAIPQLLQCGSDLACAQNVLNPILTAYGSNLATILTRIRAVYQGRLILINYYSPSPALDSLSQAVNGVMAQVVAQLSSQPNFPAIQIADAYTAFRQASTSFSYDACQAGLLIRFPVSPYAPSPCDIHPSPTGRDLIAATVETLLSK